MPLHAVTIGPQFLYAMDHAYFSQSTENNPHILDKPHLWIRAINVQNVHVLLPPPPKKKKKKKKIRGLFAWILFFDKPWGEGGGGMQPPA